MAADKICAFFGRVELSWIDAKSEWKNSFKIRFDGGRKNASFIHQNRDKHTFSMSWRDKNTHMLVIPLMRVIVWKVAKKKRKKNIWQVVDWLLWHKMKTENERESN